MLNFDFWHCSVSLFVHKDIYHKRCVREIKNAVEMKISTEIKKKKIATSVRNKTSFIYSHLYGIPFIGTGAPFDGEQETI